MPRIRPLTLGERMNDELINIIEAHMRPAKIRCYEELARKMGMSVGTMYNRIKKPGTFKLDELRLLRQILKIPPENLPVIL